MAKNFKARVLNPSPNKKFWGPEDHINYTIVQYLDYQYKHVLYMHAPNEGKRSFTAQGKFKALGGKRGVPDLLIFNPCSGFVGLALGGCDPKLAATYFISERFCYPKRNPEIH
jgi:hypothetical protein